MTNKLLDELKMAQISLAQVENIDKLQEEARTVIDDFRVNLRVKEEIQTALNNIDSKTDYQLTPDDAEQAEEIITRNADVVVAGNKVTFAGNESFGLNITPSQWRVTRGAALREMLSETYKNIKRWANQLSENFHRRWVELTTSIEVLQSRLDGLDETINVVGRVREGISKVEISELIVKSISKNGRMLSGDLAKSLQGEYNYITSCLRLWEMEQNRYKNSIIRYFGNDNNKDITIIHRDIPKLFNQRSKLDDNEGMLSIKQSLPILDGFAIAGIGLDPKWVKENIKSMADNTLYADSLSLTGYSLVKTEDNRFSKTVVNVLELSQIYTIRDVISTIINKLSAMNDENDPVNFNPEDVKDVLNTLRNGPSGSDRAYQYGLITADYQYDVNSFKTQVSSALIVLASHLLTMLNLHLECYDVE
jgi:hypothetical protein